MCDQKSKEQVMTIDFCNLFFSLVVLRGMFG